MVEHGAADDEGVAEMHGRHRGKGINIIAAHPYASRVVMADRVEKAVLRWKETRRHARVQREGHKGEKIGQSEGTADRGESGVRRSDIVVPGDEADGAGNMDESIGSVENGQCGLMAGHEPMLDRMFSQGEEEAKGAILFELEDSQAMRFGYFPD